MIIRNFIMASCLVVVFCFSLSPTASVYGIVSNTKTVFIVSCESNNSCFIPCQTTIVKGDTVMWINLSSEFRMITSGSGQRGPDGWFSSSIIPPHGTFSHTFDRTGSYIYYDNLHPYGIGVIIVGSTLDSPYVHLQQSYFSHWCVN